MAKNALQRYGEFAARNPAAVLGVALVITIFMGASALTLNIETDFNKFLPQELEAVKSQNLLSEKFSQFSNFFILAKLDTGFAVDGEITDIRHPEIMRPLYKLETILRNNPDINRVSGAPDILVNVFGKIPEDPELIKEFFGESTELFGNDYSLTILFVRVNGDLEEERLNRVVERIEEDISSVGFPGSIDVVVTGGPIISKIVFDLLFNDLIITISLALILILIALVVAYRSPFKGIFSVMALIIAVIWTGGTMKLVGIPLSLITVTVGSLVVGIGIDYAIHIINRYQEERVKRRDDLEEKCNDKKGDYHGCSKTCFICYGISVDKVGTAIIGTAITTIISFISLAGSGVPFLIDLGFALSLGIFYSMIVSLFVFPSLLVFSERINLGLRGWFSESRKNIGENSRS
jgi:hydrophobe/amphiphile efflux-3 (HAE3) family protein